MLLKTALLRECTVMRSIVLMNLTVYTVSLISRCIPDACNYHGRAHVLEALIFQFLSRLHSRILDSEVSVFLCHQF